jgi:hypothetical protein
MHLLLNAAVTTASAETETIFLVLISSGRSMVMCAPALTVIRAIHTSSVAARVRNVLYTEIDDQSQSFGYQLAS